MLKLGKLSLSDFIKEKDKKDYWTVARCIKCNLRLEPFLKYLSLLLLSSVASFSLLVRPT